MSGETPASEKLRDAQDALARASASTLLRDEVVELLERVLEELRAMDRQIDQEWGDGFYEPDPIIGELDALLQSLHNNEAPDPPTPSRREDDNPTTAETCLTDRAFYPGDYGDA